MLRVEGFYKLVLQIVMRVLLNEQLLLSSGCSPA